MPQGFMHLPRYAMPRLNFPRMKSAIIPGKEKREADHDGHAKLHYVHALDYKMYGYLQVGDEENARETFDKVMAVEMLPDDMISAYGVAAAIARYHLELQKGEEEAMAAFEGSLERTPNRLNALGKLDE